MSHVAVRSQESMLETQMVSAASSGTSVPQTDRLPKVLMVTGAYYPEISGAGLQCRELVRAFGRRAIVTVLTTCRDVSLPVHGIVDGIPIFRVTINPRRLGSKLSASVRLIMLLMRLRRQFDLMNVQGFSQKTIVLTGLAKLLRKRLVLTLQTGGEDEPASVRSSSRLAFWSYASADLFIGVSPRMRQLYEASGLAKERFRLIPNAVDLERFRPGTLREREELRQACGLPQGLHLILFVGFFSKDKCPDVLFEAWMRVQAHMSAAATGLVFVGATHGSSYDVDANLARNIKERAQALGLAQRVTFVEATHQIERYYRAADSFVLTSIREGMPIALLEAMATGLPCIATRLRGVTDTVIDHGINGLLIEPGDAEGLAGALRTLIENRSFAGVLGERARGRIIGGYAIEQAADDYLDAYRTIMSCA